MAAAQLSLFGEQVTYEDLGAPETTKAPCDKKCLRAREEVCVCRCGGKTTGYGLRLKATISHYRTLVDIRPSVKASL
jgi:hypothetical protein